jgi:hypothetical protein
VLPALQIEKTQDQNAVLEPVIKAEIINLPARFVSDLVCIVLANRPDAGGEFKDNMFSKVILNFKPSGVATMLDSLFSMSSQLHFWENIKPQLPQLKAAALFIGAISPLVLLAPPPPSL